jgi:hypothetical protein
LAQDWRSEYHDRGSVYDDEKTVESILNPGSLVYDVHSQGRQVDAVLPNGSELP